MHVLSAWKKQNGKRLPKDAKDFIKNAFEILYPFTVGAACEKILEAGKEFRRSRRKYSVTGEKSCKKGNSGKIF